jgi:hypothetical protein
MTFQLLSQCPEGILRVSILSRCIYILCDMNNKQALTRGLLVHDFRFNPLLCHCATVPLRTALKPHSWGRCKKKSPASFHTQTDGVKLHESKCLHCKRRMTQQTRMTAYGAIHTKSVFILKTIF